MYMFLNTYLYIFQGLSISGPCTSCNNPCQSCFSLLPHLALLCLSYHSMQQFRSPKYKVINEKSVYVAYTTNLMYQ